MLFYFYIANNKSPNDYKYILQQVLVLGADDTKSQQITELDGVSRETLQGYIVKYPTDDAIRLK